MANTFIQFVVFLHVIDSFVYCQPTIETSGQAFVQTDNELRYMVEGMHLQIPGQKVVDIRWDDTTTNSVLFEPPLLDFEEQPVGMPQIERVTVQNTDTKNSLHLLSISGSTSHFHCSFFQEKHVPPGGNTTFEVVFLARRVGNVENTLYIHTSVGTFKYQVFGVGIPNPYRLRPLLGAKVAINTSFSPLIHLHNPHSSTLQVEEIYTSGGDLHLQLPTGELEATKQLWEIPPYDTKPIMKANFLGRVANNHTAFIRIKTNKENAENILVLPVEVEVNADPGIFSMLDKLDFGIVRSCDLPKKIELNLYSSRVYPVPIHEIYVSPPNDAIQIDFQPTYLKADLWEASTVAHISFNASRAKHIKQSSGVIVIKSKTESRQHVIPFQATVLHGYLFYDKNKTYFFTGQQNRTINRNLPLTNMFNFSLAIHNISISEDKADYFSFDRWEHPVVIKKGDTQIPFALNFHMNVTGLQFKTHLLLHTNASTFYIPIHVYNGKLKTVHHRPALFRNQLDFGTLDFDTEYSLLLTLRNENPVNINIRNVSAGLHNSRMELLGVEEGTGTTLTRRHNSSLIESSSFTIPPNHFAVFNISIKTCDYEGGFGGEYLFYTQFENLYVPFTLRTAEGSIAIDPQVVKLENCFPGKVCRHRFSLTSSFTRYMKVNELSFEPDEGNLFYYTSPSPKDVVLAPFVQVDAGLLSFDLQHSASGCHDDCYLALPTYFPAGHRWLQGTALEEATADVDQYLYTHFKKKWTEIVQQQNNVVNVTVQLDTNEIRGFLFHAQAHLIWPSIVRRSRIDFPLTQIRNTSVHELLLENPSDVPVIVQVLPLVLYPSPETIFKLMHNNLAADLNAIVDSSFSYAFSVRDLQPKHRHYNFTRRERQKIEKTFNVTTHRDTLVVMLNASSSLKIHIGFTPPDDASHTSLLLIRNNLTILETVVVQGTGGRGDIRLDNKKTGSVLPFVVTDTNCDIKKSSTDIPNFTVKNKFKAKNTGQLPFYINSFAVNDQECEGYGFKVLECGGFELLPNDSKVITIAFTPDFSMSRIQRVLTIHTSLGPALNYTLHATVPPHLLTKCSAAVPRPTWEPHLYYAMVCGLCFVLCCIVISAYFEGDRIYMTEVRRARIRASLPPDLQSNGSIDSSKIFDLNNLEGDKAVVNGGCNNHRANGVIGHSKSVEMLATTGHTAAGTHTPSRPTSGRKKRDNSSISSYIYKALGYLKFPFKLKFFKLAKSERNSFSAKSSEKESKSFSRNSYNKTDSSQSSTPQTTIVRRSSNGETFDENTRNTRKNKAPKRQFPDIIKDHVDRSSNNKGSKDYNHDTTSNNKKAADRKKTDRFNGIDPVDTRSHNTSPEIYDDEQREKRNRKWKKESYADKRATETDDTSSTTTESSIEEKSSTHDSTPEPLPPRCKKSRGKGNKKKDVGVYENLDNDFYEDEFIIGSRSKAHRKMNGDFGGNILRPSSLELPYKLEGDSPRPGSNDLSPHALVGRRTRNKDKKSKLTPFNFNNMLDENNLPFPVWDQPKSIEINDDLSEMALQTQLFAQKTRGGGSLNETLSTSSRSSSYSSVVSSGSENKANGNDRNFALSPIGIDAKAPGSMVNSKGNSISPGIGGGRKQAWHGGTDSQLSPGNSFGLEPITETSAVSSGFSVAAPMFVAPGSGTENIPRFSPNSLGQQQQPATMMQRLMADRRKRQMEYEQKRLNEKWPFFDTVLPQENALWDMTAPTSDTWAAPTSTQSANAIWDPTLTGTTATQNWGNVGSIWSSPTTLTPEVTGSGATAAGEAVAMDQSAGGSGAYDPFNNLWNPSNFGVQGHAWSNFSPPKPDEN